jgi:hypothetical protein
MKPQKLIKATSSKKKDYVFVSPPLAEEKEKVKVPLVLLPVKEKEEK